MSQRTVRFVLGDQLSPDLASLRDLDPARDVVLMAEVAEETGYVGHHKQKIALVLSAMRRFADELRDNDIDVDYVELDDPGNAGTLSAELDRAVHRHRPDRIVVTEPGEWRVWEAMRGWQERLGLPVEIREDDRFFASRDRFARWAEGRKAFRMEHFYREMRRESGLLMRGDAPIGDRWNYDAENRQPWPTGEDPPERRRFAPDANTDAVLALVEDRFPDNFGDLRPFGWAVTRREALQALDDFIAHALPRFGDFQDAMKTDAPFLNHAVLSPYLNIGLLTPRELCDRAAAALEQGHAPLNAVEGFIRQILGWREYVRGIYWHCMPDYAGMNALGADRALPAFYWSGDTDLNCLARAIDDTRRHAYSHHIQRLMITGTFALLAGVRPQDVSDWYLAVYADAFDWVELPNTLGMSQFADGGLLGSKPYAASGAYINRMSDFCRACTYDVKQKTGPEACPFNYLYWGFLRRNRSRLESNPRLSMPYRQLAKMPDERRRTIAKDAQAFLDNLA